MSNIIEHLKQQLATILVTALAAVLLAGGSMWLNVRDLQAADAQYESKLEKAEIEQKVLSEEIVNLRIAARELAVAIDNLSKEVQNLRNERAASRRERAR